MNPVNRGIKNAFRNGLRSGAVIIILGLAIGLCLTMLIAERAVNNKIKSVKSSIGNTITISPAGFRPGAQANNALTTSQLDKVKKINHITGVDESLSDRLSTTGSSQPSFGRFGGSSSSNESTTSLKSPTTLNFNRSGNSGNRGGFFVNGGSGGNLPTNFSLPVSFLGTTDPSSIDSNVIAIKSGKTIDATKDSNVALISKKMASKNSLKVGSTFKAYDTKITVVGIFTSSNQSAQGTVVLSLPTLEDLSGQSGNITSAVATVDSLDNLTSATSAIKSTLGSSADVTSAEEQADNTVAPLNSVKTVAEFSLIGAIVAGAIIILLMMIIIVRERKKEIGIVKAIGSGNVRIAGEFMVEALTLTIIGAIIGLIIGVIAGQPVTKMLVNNNSNSSSNSSSQREFGRGGPGFGGNNSGSTSNSGGNRPPGGFGGFGQRFQNNGTVKSLDNIQTEIGWGILLDGLGAAVIIALIGSLLATGLIVRVRPSTIMRSDQ